MIRTSKWFLRYLAVFGAVLGPACSGDDAPPPAGAGGSDAGAGGKSDASTEGASGSTSSGGHGGSKTEAGASGSGGGGASGSAGNGGGGAGGGSGAAASGGAGGATGTGGLDAGAGTGGATTAGEGGPVDGGRQGSTDGAVEAEAAPCLSPRVACPSACADLSSDVNNCGACSHTCTGLEACVNGSCTSAHCGSSPKFIVESELLLAPSSSDGGADGGGSSGGSVAPNMLLLARSGSSGSLDAWMAASDGVYRALAGGAAILSNPVSVLGGASQSIAVTKLDGDAGIAMPALVNDTSSDVELALGSPAAGYSVAGTISMGDHQGSVLSVDIDGDGQNEIVVAAVIPSSANSLAIYKVPPLGQPFLWRSRLLPLGGSPAVYGLAAGNFDHDGYRDIALAAYGSEPVLVTFQNSPSDISDPVLHVLPGGRARSPLVFDFDNDGFDDVTVVAGKSVHFFAGSSTGLAADPFTTSPETTYSYADAAAGDFDRDGKLDLALVRRLPSGGTQVLPAWGDAHGAFVPDFTQATAPAPVSGIAAGDIDGDTRPDLVVISADHGSVTAIKNACN